MYKKILFISILVLCSNISANALDQTTQNKIDITRIKTDVSNLQDSTKALGTSVQNIQKDYRALYNAGVEAREFYDDILQGNIETEAALREYNDDNIKQSIDKESLDRYEADRKQQSQLDYHNEHITNLYNEMDNNYKEHDEIRNSITNEANHRKAEDLKIKNSVEQNRQGLNELKPKVSNNTKAIEDLRNSDTHIQNTLDRHSESINNNAKVIKQLNTRIDGLERSVNKLDNKLETGLATVSALTALHPNPRYKGRTQVAIGAGMYADNVAGAIGVFHWVNDRVMLNAGASYGGDSSFAGNCGISIGL